MQPSIKTISIVESTLPLVEEKINEIVSTFYELLLSKNVELKNIFNKTNQDNKSQQVALVNAIIKYIKNIKDLDKLSNLVSVISTKHASLSIQPEHYPIVGKHLIDAIKIVLGDLNEEIISSWIEVYDFLANILIDAERQLYKKSIEINGWNGWKKFVISKREKNNDKITSFYLKPCDNSKIPDFLPGQYISIKIFLKELELEQIRQYSLSDAPNNEYLRISVNKELPYKDQNPMEMVSAHLHDNIKEGDVVSITSPQGLFIVNDQNHQLVLIAAGVGVTPILSIFYSLIDSKKDILFIYAYRDDSVALDLEKLKQISKNNDGIKMIFYSENESESSNYKGFVNTDHFIDDIKSEANFYICGPEKFIIAQINNLRRIGIKEDKMNYELFSPNIVL